VAEPLHDNDSPTAEAAADNTGGYDDISASLRHIEVTLAAVRADLAAANDRAAARERVIDRLYEENQRLRNGERQSLLRPVVVDLYRLRDDLLRQAPNLPERITAERMKALLESFAYSAEQALERCGVHLVRPAPGDEFDPRRHRAAGSAPTDAPDQDGRVAEVLADGYLDSVDGRVLSPAAVRLARWTPPADRLPETPLDQSGFAGHQD